MQKKPSHTCSWIGALALLLMPLSLAHAAKPADKGGGSVTTEAASSAPPEFYWAAFDYTRRTLTLHGVNLITGEPGTPVLPGLTIGGQTTEIDPSSGDCSELGASNECSLLIPFNNILDALVSTTPGGRIVPAEDSYAVKVVTVNGSAMLSAYIPADITDDTASPPPPTTGTCPCTGLYDSYYNSLYALVWPTCTSPESWNPPATGTVQEEQYIEAFLIDTLHGRNVTIASDSSTSPRSAFASSCYVLNYGEYLGGGPLPVSDEDHLACVVDIKAREGICRGCGWLDENCPNP